MDSDSNPVSPISLSETPKPPSAILLDHDFYWEEQELKNLLIKEKNEIPLIIDEFDSDSPLKSARNEAIAWMLKGLEVHRVRDLWDSEGVGDIWLYDEGFSHPQCWVRRLLCDEFFVRNIGYRLTVEGATPESTLVCKLKKSLYASDQSFFYKSDGAAGFFGIVVYVDDILVGTTNPEMTNDFKKFLTQHFKFKDLGDPKYFLELEIARNKKGIQISQRKYTMDLLKDTSFMGSKPSAIPMDPLKKLQLDSGTIGRCFQYVSKPCIEHWQAAEKVLKYLKASLGHGLFYSNSSKPNLSIFSYADWAASD
ncbi:hypothetical protein SASPL_143867 [Salvia splendens]|uniref:Reverse transcriptase Ty1/copia-type domain-containing protein n=1 Tax=Salvia splendens TaxID=180675 RepID=A0A8X8ZAR0_SALSN|nr:hypothetical protein SASPL_143867 [Salvia splendens]